jgi:AraC family cel operon transcriptional repressor
VFIRKSDVHSFAYRPTNEPSFINITFTEEILMDLFRYLSDGYPSDKLLNMPDPPCVYMSETDIDWYIKQLEMLNTIETTDIPTLKYQLRFLLMKLFTRYFSQTSHPLHIPDNVPRWLYYLHKEMQKPQNFCQDIDHMVAMSGKSREYLGRLLKQYYGVTITEYINDLRLNYWANILTTSDIPILDSCYECGFQNVSWAYSLFKKKYGVSPLKYRNFSL